MKHEQIEFLTNCLNWLWQLRKNIDENELVSESRRNDFTSKWWFIELQ